MADELARAVTIEKSYGDVVAVRAATIAFRAGVIHAVCGENGAGKSTLLKIVAGMLVPDGGHVEALGSRLEPHTPAEAIRRGVGMVLQHFALVPAFTALENIILGAEPVSALGVLDLASARRRAESLARELAIDLPLDARVASLGLGERQRLEIARALYRDAKLLILDEPTAVLTKGEAASLYATLRRLAEAGTGIVVVTHKMDEVATHADVVSVMRRGEVLFTRPLTRGDESAVREEVEAITAAIMGQTAKKTSASPPAQVAGSTDAIVLDVLDVHVGRALVGASFSLRAGEIVGLAGIDGNGQQELVSVLARDRLPDSGEVRGAETSVLREDRQSEGLVLDASLRDNVMLGELGSFTSALGIIDLRAFEAEATTRLARSGAPSDPDRVARTLSGGNQQKIVVERALARLGENRARVLVLSHPTRGVDAGATQEIHARVRAAASKGVAVLVISADLDELRALCSRIYVIARGRIVAEFPPTTSDEVLGRSMLGIDSFDAPAAASAAASGARA